MVRTDGRRDLVRASKFAVLLSEASPRPRLVVLICARRERPGDMMSLPVLLRRSFVTGSACLPRDSSNDHPAACLPVASTEPSPPEEESTKLSAVDGQPFSVRASIRSSGLRRSCICVAVTPISLQRPPYPSQYPGGGPNRRVRTPPPTLQTRQLRTEPQPELGDSEPALEDRGLAAMRVPPRPPLTETGPPPRAPSTGSQGVGASSASRTRESRKQRNGSSPAKTGPAPTRKKTFSALAAAVGTRALLAALLVLILPGGSGPTPAPSTLSPGASLQPGQSLSSPNGIFVLAMRPDGNLVDYSRHGGETLWETGTGGHFGAYARLQFDGNLVVYPKGKKRATAGPADIRVVVLGNRRVTPFLSRVE